MRQIAFNNIFDEDNIVRIRFETEHGQILSFVVQLECFFEGYEWLPIVRYDTAHGFAHRDTLHPKQETEKTELAVRDYNEGMNYAIEDIKANWQFYRRRYEEWLKE